MTTPDRIIIWGAGGHAKVVADILRQTGFEVVGFIDDMNLERRGETFCGATVLGGKPELDGLRGAGIRHSIVAFADNARRIAAGELLESAGFELVRAIHPSATLARDATFGEGSLMAAGAVVNPSTSVGRHVILNTRSSVDHDCQVEDGAHVGPGASIAGNVHIGRGAWIGIGATVIEQKRIGARSVVGAGAVVIDNVPEGVVVVGVPARIIKPRHLSRSIQASE